MRGTVFAADLDFFVYWNGVAVVEFVAEQEVLTILKGLGIAPNDDAATSGAGDDDAVVRLRLQDSENVVRLFVSAPGAEVSAPAGAREMEMDHEKMAQMVEDAIVHLHLSEVLLIPLSKWRNVFDCVAFSLADNEAWTEVDATASVELNRRDPLLCLPSDYHTLRALVAALLQDAEGEKQNLMVTTTAAPVLIEVIAGGAIQINVGNEVLADELIGSLA